jgi:hypothetical protein
LCNFVAHLLEKFKILKTRCALLFIGIQSPPKIFPRG